MPVTLDVLTVLLGLAGVMLLAAGLRRLWRRRLVLGGTGVLFGVVLLAAALLLGGLALNLHTYRRLTAEQEVAELYFQGLGPQYYRRSCGIRRGSRRRSNCAGTSGSWTPASSSGMDSPISWASIPCTGWNG